MYEEWVSDIIFSGDIPGYIRRRSEFLSNDFLGYMEEQLEATTDADEKEAYQQIFKILSRSLLETDGLLDSGVVFESRLSKILFTPPNRRKDTILGDENKLSNITFLTLSLKYVV